jgi:hypothetical protein
MYKGMLWSDFLLCCVLEEFEDTKGVIKIRKSEKDRRQRVWPNSTICYKFDKNWL